MLLAARTGSASRSPVPTAWNCRPLPQPSWGVRADGGKGTIVGAMLGVLILGVLNNGMILTSVPPSTRWWREASP